MRPDTPFNYDFEEPHLKDLQLNLQVAVAKLFYYDSEETDSLAFERNFRECQRMFEQLNREIDGEQDG
jgi:hypothetical protein